MYLKNIFFQHLSCNHCKKSKFCKCINGSNIICTINFFFFIWALGNQKKTKILTVYKYGCVHAFSKSVREQYVNIFAKAKLSFCKIYYLSHMRVTYTKRMLDAAFMLDILMYHVHWIK